MDSRERKGHVFPYWWRQPKRHHSFQCTWKMCYHNVISVYNTNSTIHLFSDTDTQSWCTLSVRTFAYATKYNRLLHTYDNKLDKKLNARRIHSLLSVFLFDLGKSSQTISKGNIMRERWHTQIHAFERVNHLCTRMQTYGKLRFAPNLMRTMCTDHRTHK